ncbi:MAG: hypothetical protein SFX73_11740 [Kofleriaceae bacterium]|nr:hypothetical protein [Kofleriaceae bacterium]
MNREELRAREALRNALRVRLTFAKAALDDCARGLAITEEAALSIHSRLIECEVDLLRAATELHDAANLRINGAA